MVDLAATNRRVVAFGRVVESTTDSGVGAIGLDQVARAAGDGGADPVSAVAVSPTGGRVVSRASVLGPATHGGEVGGHAVGVRFGVDVEVYRTTAGNGAAHDAGAHKISD